MLASAMPMATAVPTRRTAGIDPAKTLHYELDNSFFRDKPAHAGDRVLSHRIGDVGRKKPDQPSPYALLSPINPQFADSP